MDLLVLIESKTVGGSPVFFNHELKPSADSLSLSTCFFEYVLVNRSRLFGFLSNQASNNESLLGLAKL